MPNFLKNKKLLAIILSSIFIVVTLAVGVYAAVNRGPSLPVNADKSNTAESDASSKDALAESLQPESSKPPEFSESSQPEKEEPPVILNVPHDMKAAYLTAGYEFLTGNTDSATVKAEIDKALAKAKEFTLNTIIVNTRYKDTVLYSISGMPGTASDFDVLSYIIEKCKANELRVYAIVDSMALFENGKVVTIDYADGTSIDKLSSNMKEFTDKYAVDGILLDNYYNVQDSNSYSNYLKYGGGIGFDHYMRQVPHQVVSALSETIRKYAPATQIGLLTDAVWANKADQEDGSDTKASFATLTNGNADTKQFVEEKLVDFIAVKAYGSLTDSATPFGKVTKWWSDLAKANEMPFFTVLASDKIASTAPGWSGADQLVLQIDEAKKLDNYSGCIFNSLKRLIENPKDSTTLLVKYFNNQVNVDFILTELTFTKPKEGTTFSTYEQKVTFTGASDPTEEVIMNGQKVDTDANGFFSVEIELKPGLNTFKFEHKEKTVIYNITRKIEILKEVSPVGSVTVEGGMKIKFTALAYSDAKVYAVINGQTIGMSIDTTEDDNTDRDSSYVKFSGTYTAPAATAGVQNLGNITFYGEWQGEKASKQGASVKVNKKPVIGEGRLVQITTDGAETFPTNTLDDTSSPYCYPLAKGALDYTVGDEIVYRDGNSTYTYYILQSGQRVYSKDISSTGASEPQNNKIKGITITADSQYTNVILNTEQKVSYEFSYDTSNITIDFSYTSSVPGNMNSLSKNPMFSSAKWSGSKLTLTLRSPGSFMGYRGYFDSNGNLVFRFNNPPSSISGARIVIDPGHGNSDIGAVGFNPSYPESYLNQVIAKKTASVLRSRGASVLLLDTDSSPVKMVQRIAQAKNYNAQIYVSIHHNAAGASAKGSEAYYFYPFSKGLAVNASSNLASSLNTTNRGAKFGYFFVTRDSAFASILAECGFVTNRTEYEKLLDDGYQDSMAIGLVNAISSYINSMRTGSTATGTESNGEANSTPVESVKLDVNSLQLKIGDKYTFTAVVKPSEATNKAVNWTSSNTGVATVNAAGELQAKAVGTAEITVTTQDGSKTDKCTVTVIKPVTKITLPESLEIDLNETKLLTATITPTDATIKELTWSSDNEQVATVDQKGNVKGVKAGTANITATAKDGSKVKASTKVTVKSANIPLTGISVSPANKTLDIGESVDLIITFNPSNATNQKITITSNSECVAINGTTVTAKSAGSAVITVTSEEGKYTGSCKITVNPASSADIPPTSVELSDSTLNMKIGDTATLVATVKPGDATDQTVSWASDNAVVTVDQNGNIKAVAEGKATITVRTQNGKTATCSVTVTRESSTSSPASTPESSIPQSSSTTI